MIVRLKSTFNRMAEYELAKRHSVDDFPEFLHAYGWNFFAYDFGLFREALFAL